MVWCGVVWWDGVEDGMWWDVVEDGEWCDGAGGSGGGC